MEKLFYFIFLFIIGHIFVWYQTNGQFISKAFKDNVWIVSLMGMPLAYLFIQATKIGYEAFNEKLWPIRIVGFTVGTVVFSLMTYMHLEEGLDTKTIICLLLCIAIIMVQIAF